MRLSSFLIKKRGKNLFFPAHGRGLALPKELKSLLRRRPGIWDLPELPDLGDGISGSGLISLSQKEIASQFGVDRCWYGVNGATGLLQAGVLAIAKPGQNILMPRNVHRSIINACIFGGINPVFFDLPFLADRGHFYPPDSLWLESVLNKVDSASIDLSAVVLVNPTYHGYSSDLKPLVKRIHKDKLPVLIDEAHGAHFFNCLDSSLPSSGIKVGADIVVHSLHKSSVGLSQTAVLWSQGNLVDPKKIERSLTWLQTSSPNSLLLSSCESSIKEWSTNFGQRKLINTLDLARETFEDLTRSGIPLLKTQDPLKLVLHTSSKGISGFDADNWFYRKQLIAELPEPGTLTFCMGFSSQKGLVKDMKNKWFELLDSDINKSLKPFFQSPQYPLVSTLKTSCSFASTSKSHKVLIKDAIGLISAEMICPYPPGIPILIPGEELGKKLIDWMLVQKRLWPNQVPAQINVLL